MPTLAYQALYIRVLVHHTDVALSIQTNQRTDKRSNQSESHEAVNKTSIELPSRARLREPTFASRNASASAYTALEVAQLLASNDTLKLRLSLLESCKSFTCEVGKPTLLHRSASSPRGGVRSM
ncbi:hypothetical protein EVAR_77025_1 [Eumeta japonica]|uniref:Uncharacterized protein n=1 Tax=Eumeta variegata TaxID=151549 RepID=A0A4C1SFP8_EUMVA|nr:hypothetical protein EVAR_77025_1 [Eumeta japonica]